MSRARIRFETFELDVESSELWNNGRRVKLAPKPARVLALLANAPGRLVTRETIRENLWEPDTFVDFEHGLNFCIREIRAALGDNAQKPRFVETLPRRGYRFIAGPPEALAPEVPPASSESREIEAYEHYLKARENLAKMDKSSLERAREDFERALALQPRYAMAHSGLGATHAMRTINRRDPVDLETARAHLMRALELDEELAEPYPWLCYVNMRLSRSDLAIEAGHRGVQLQPNLVHAHYFLGLAYFASSERDVLNYQPAVDHLSQATQVGPGWQASWFVLSCVALAHGDYPNSRRFAGRLLELNGQTGGVPFIGAELVLASVYLREGRFAGARDILLDFLARLDFSDHMYRSSMSATAACVLGDAELRDRRAAEALAAYRRGWHLVQEHTRMVAHLRISARVQAGLAAAYAAIHTPKRAVDLLDTAACLAARSEAPEHAAAGVSLYELYWSLAVASVRLRNRQRALEMLEKSVSAGWMDRPWLENDPELCTLHAEPGFRALADRIERTRNVRFPTT